MSRARATRHPVLGEEVSSAKARFQRVSARQARPGVDPIPGITVAHAPRQQGPNPPPTALPIVSSVLKSAVANAKTKEYAGDVGALVIGDAQVGGGPMLKRFRPRAMGRACTIRKRTSHVTIKLFTEAD